MKYQKVYLLLAGVLSQCFFSVTSQLEDSLVKSLTPESETVCGSDPYRSLEHDGMQRHYLLYVPPSVCARKQPAPIVFGLHCLGCPVDIFKAWEPLADQFGMVLVSPEGYMRSWNAVHCCGPALEEKLDDAGFVKALVQEVQRLLGPMASSQVFAFGWSNGGFLAALVAMQPGSPFRAIAPISGHQYRDHYSLDGVRPVPTFFHHGLDDDFVRYEGCCEGQGRLEPRCCCGISEASGPTCVDAGTAFRRWGRDVNKCDLSKPIPTPTVVRRDEELGMTCQTLHGCSANTTLCAYDEFGHFNRRAFPLREEVLRFFGREACGSSASSGEWLEPRGRCKCTPPEDDGWGTVGPYCFQVKRAALGVK